MLGLKAIIINFVIIMIMGFTYDLYEKYNNVRKKTVQVFFVSSLPTKC